MKDPQAAIDPRSVSAYSVYRGLVPELKTYQDTSEGSNASRRKKARRRNRKSASKNDEGLKIDNAATTASDAEEVPPVPTTATSKTKKNSKAAESEMKQVTSTSQKKGPKGMKNGALNSGTPQPSSDKDVVSVSNGGGGEEEQKKKRKKKKKSKKAANNVDDHGDLNDTAEGQIYATDEDDDEGDEQASAPHKKAKTMMNGTDVPNPLAFKGMNGKAKPSSKKDKGQKPSSSSTLSTLPIQSSTKKTTANAKTDKKKAPKDKASASSAPTVAPGAPGKVKGKKGVQHLSTVVADESYKVESRIPPPDEKQVFTSKRVENSVEQGKTVLEWMIHPVTSDEFLEDYFEKKPLLIKRLHNDSKDFYKSILTTQSLDDVLRRNVLKYGVNLDITSYENGVRETLSESMQGRVRPAVVWDYYNNGCSLRMLNPQSYIQRLWRVNSALQELFGSFVGANMYLTPPESQGFAPHYDDIEAFILQIEGKKQWRVYAPRSENEKLPRFSSGNFNEGVDNLGKLIIDVTLEEGDMLYFPRGYIHQAKTVDGEHSLHITVSCHQLNTYGDLLKHHVNYALENLISNDVMFREGLPTDYLSYMGIAHENSKDKEIKKKREAFSKRVGALVSKLAKEPADFAADAMGKKFIWDSLPPFLAPKERGTCVLEDGEFMQNGKVFNRVEFGPEVEVKLIRKNCVRLMVEEGLVKLYYSSENSMVYHEEDSQFVEFAVQLVPMVNHLISHYPEYTKIEDLPFRNNKDIGQKIQVIADLWERGLIFTKKPLEACDLDEDFDLDGSDQDDDNKQNHDDEDDVESIDLSELPEEDDDEEGTADEFYDTSMMDSVLDSDATSGSDSDLSIMSNSEEEIDDGQADEGDYFGFGGGYAIDATEDSNEEDSEDEDIEEEELDDEEGEEEEEIDEDEFDRMDRMEESDDEED